jgi:hypothetical protein
MKGNELFHERSVTKDGTSGIAYLDRNGERLGVNYYPSIRRVEVHTELWIKTEMDSNPPEITRGRLGIGRRRLQFTSPTGRTVLQVTPSGEYRLKGKGIQR